MDVEQSRRSLELFRQVVEVEPDQRAGYLERACAGDEALRGEVEALLVAQVASASLLEHPPRIGDHSSSSRDPLVGTRLGHYHLKRVISSGGMGTVYEATQEHPRRTVAVKVMRPGVASKSTLRRFEYESQILGRLRHPGIAQIFEACIHGEADGTVDVPYFVMEYVPNARTIVDYANERKLEPSERLALFMRTCEAIHHGHQKGIIHRDLKPGNILVDSSGQVKVIDFGVARATDSDLALTTLQTQVGSLVGTLQYMSPEQCDADPHDLDIRSDVYALGVVLYELLCSKPPYDVRDQPVYEAVRRIREEQPVRPSTTVRTLRGDLETILLKTLEKDRTRRYQSADELRRDIARYLEGLPISARPPSALYHLRSFTRRNKVLVGGVAGVFLALAAGVATSTSLYVRVAREKAMVLRLSDVKVLQELETEADDLWPAYPESIGELESWLDRARTLVGNLAVHRETLSRMRGRANPWSDEERALDRETHPWADELVDKRAELEGLIAQLEQGLEGEARETADKRIAELEPAIAGLTDEVESRRTWSFDTAEDQWQHGVLAELIGNLEEFESGLLAENAVTAYHGWSVPKRLSAAQELEAAFAEGGEYASAWAKALPGIREAYPGLNLKLQMSLLPIGPDPASGLWEFAHLMTGEPAARGEDGKLILTEETGVVLVLLPGGRFRMGAQKDDPTGRNYAPQARSNEGPVHEVQLSAFFLSKYEMTQGQWLRLMGRNPSYYKDSVWAPTLLHPVEQVSWPDCMEWLPRAGLALPSEAQWEYGARAGTETVWWTGSKKESLEGSANLADQAADRADAPWPEIKDWPELDDGYAFHAPVDTYAANGFGLHEVHGNMWEWCLDGYDDGFYGRGPREDPVAPQEGAAAHVIRGGSFTYAALFARSALRFDTTPSRADGSLGVRPARALDP